MKTILSLNPGITKFQFVSFHNLDFIVESDLENETLIGVKISDLPNVLKPDQKRDNIPQQLVFKILMRSKESSFFSLEGSFLKESRPLMINYSKTSYLGWINSEIIKSYVHRYLQKSLFGKVFPSKVKQDSMSLSN